MQCFFLNKLCRFSKHGHVSVREGLVAGLSGIKIVDNNNLSQSHIFLVVLEEHRHVISDKRQNRFS